MTNLICKPILIVILITLSFFGYCQTSNNVSLISKFDSIANKVPREKIYLHTDKSIYALPDTIWFKAYLMAADSLNYSKISSLVYIDLINSKGTIIKTLRLPTAMGITWGGINLNQRLYPPGVYTLRAYTNWMQNFGDVFFFTKEINILGNDKEETKSLKTKNNTTTVPSKAAPIEGSSSESIKFKFFPESGNWLEKKLQKMGFMILDKNGNGLKMKGEIIDGQQKRITTFESNDKGMGYFNMTPLSNENYFVSIAMANGSSKFLLPKTTRTGTTVQVHNNYANDSINITVHSNLKDKQLTVLGQARGHLYFITQIPANKSIREISLHKSIFPSGICQITLLDDKQQTINERAFFIDHKDALKIQIDNDKAQYTNRDSISIRIKVTDALNQPVSGSFSISVTDNGQVFKNSINDTNILTYFLLNADLINAPNDLALYLNIKNEDTYNELDMLLLMQPYISYNWDFKRKINYVTEKEFSITGKVSNILNKPVENVNLSLLDLNKGILLNSHTNKQGQFIFRDFPMLDSVSFMLLATNKNNKSGTLGIELNKWQSPITKMGSFTSISKSEALDSVSKNIVNIRQKQFNPYPIDGILLKEINISGKKVIKGSNNLNGNGNADIILNEEDFVKMPKKTLFDIVKENAEMFYTSSPPKSALLRYYFNNNIAQLIIDGENINEIYQLTNGSWGSKTEDYINFFKHFLDFYKAEDLKGIEFMTSGKYTAEYDYKYKSPARNIIYIEVTTKAGTGPFLEKSANLVRIRPINYANKLFFYNPQYSITTKSNSIPDLRSTIYWNPNVTTDENGNATVSFFSTDRKDNYTFWIEGTDLRGNFGIQTKQLIIK